jgi:opacity protein-like surface antigen
MPRINRVINRCSKPSLGKISLKSAAARFGLAAMVALSVRGAAEAQEQARTHSVEVYAGELFGDNLTDTPISGRTPRLNDDVTFGARYNFNITDTWGIQLSTGYTPTRAARVTGGSNNLDLTTVDLDAVWNITPQYPMVLYALAGAGYAWGKLGSTYLGSDRRPARDSQGQQRLHGQCRARREILHDTKFVSRPRRTLPIPRPARQRLEPKPKYH